MFYAAMALLQQLPRIPSKHAGVISLFDTESVLKGIFPKELSKAFHKAFELRQICDYRVTTPPSIKQARQAYESATRFVQEDSRYLS